MQKTVVVLGGTSDIGRATGLRFAQSGWQVVLAARNVGEAKRNAQDISIRAGATVPVLPLDILQSGQFPDFVADLPALPDVVVCVIGELGDQVKAQSDLSHASVVMRTNFEGPALLLGIFADKFAGRGSGTIVGVSSVAGDRGRGSNYIYGSAKAGFTAFLSGLRNRLAAGGVHVVTVKPGFVRTRMTADLKLPPVVTAEASEVGDAIYKAVAGAKKDVIYVRPLWWIIMTIICAIPERIFKTMKL
jgi:NAD(P)-dependent dehydrogenase (short-subunit alcohol dehydrogenase family)